jgi:hypothetical protein
MLYKARDDVFRMLRYILFERKYGVGGVFSLVELRDDIIVVDDGHNLCHTNGDYWELTQLRVQARARVFE